MPRTLMKTLTYSAMHLCVAIAVAYALTGSWAVAIGIGLVEPFVQTIAYTVHERLWEKFMPGRCEPVESVHACSHTLTRIRDSLDGPADPRALPGPA